MGKQSDNTAYGVVLDLLGEEGVQNYIESVGMESTNVYENETTARDVSLFFVKLWRGNLLGSEYRDVLIESLKDTAYEDWMRAGIDGDVEVAHKFGREVHVLNDAGIVMSEREPFVLVMLSEGVDDSEADEAVRNLAKAVWEWRENR
jgi:beta-lactamase class A